MEATVALLEQQEQSKNDRKQKTADQLRSEYENTEKLLQTINFNIESINEEEQTLVAIASDTSLDRHDDVVEQDWELDNFKKNPVLLAFHDSQRFSIGKVQRIGLDESESRLMFEAKFAVEENPDARIAWNLYKNGYQRAFSVGFKPLEMELEERLDEDGDVFLSIRFKRNELLEISAVTVPANANAVTLAYQDGVITEEDRKYLIDAYQKQVDYLTNVKPVKNNKSKSKGGATMEEVKQEIEELKNAVSSLTDEVKQLKSDQESEQDSGQSEDQDTDSDSGSGDDTDSDDSDSANSGGNDTDTEGADDSDSGDAVEYDEDEVPEEVAEEVEAHVQRELAKDAGRVE